MRKPHDQPIRLRISILWPLASALALAACATLGGGGGNAPVFPGTQAVTQRIQDLNGKALVASDCAKTRTAADKGGIIEVTAAADGKLSARTIVWEGSPEIASCIVAAAQKATLPPLAGPPVSTVWQFRAPGAAAPNPPDPAAFQETMAGLAGRLQQSVNACAQRNLPPEFPTDIDVSFAVLPGGKVAAANVSTSTSNDGNFDACVLQLFGDLTVGGPASDTPMPLKLHFHVGRLNEQM